jgi:hypothetical protein
MIMEFISFMILGIVVISLFVTIACDRSVEHLLPLYNILDQFLFRRSNYGVTWISVEITHSSVSITFDTGGTYLAAVSDDGHRQHLHVLHLIVQGKV